MSSSSRSCSRPSRYEQFRCLLGRRATIDSSLLVTTILVVHAVALMPAMIMTVHATANMNDNDNDNIHSIQCGVYLAPSSIPGAGLGMYAGNRSIDRHEIVTNEDILIPIVEKNWHIEERLQDRNFLWDEYIWNSETILFTAGEIGKDLQSYMTMASPGVGAAANCYLSMVNVEDDPIQLSRADVPRESPGQGAFTIYHGRSFYAIDDIEPGQELFVK